jgi:lysozyme family protein
MAQYRYERLQPDYAHLWGEMMVTKTSAAIAQARKVIAGKARYKVVEARTGVPWFVVGCLHMRESNGDFTTWLHNGDRMRRKSDGLPIRTVHVTAGRPLDPNVTWEEGAYDALVTCQRFDEVTDWCPERVAYITEDFNGWGYRHPARNIPSPYLWGGTSVQKRGKFTEDHVYDKNVMDPQLGAMAVLKTLMEIDPEARFAEPEVPAEPETAPAEADDVDESAPASPKAVDAETQVKPLHKSQTIWGVVTTYGAYLIAMLKGFVHELHDPYMLAAFLGLVAAGSVGLWLSVTGRINVQKIIAHLSEDDTHA